MMMGCDTLLTVGSNFPYTQFLPEARPGPRRPDRPLRQVDRHALPVRAQPGRRRASDTLQALIPLLQRKADRRWREEIESDVARVVGRPSAQRT